MAGNLVLDGFLSVGGTFSASGVINFTNSATFSGTITNSGTENFTGTQNFSATANFTTASNVFFNATTLTLTAGNVSTAIVNSCTLNTRAGKITTTSLTGFAQSVMTVLVTNSVVSTTDLVIPCLMGGSATAGSIGNLSVTLGSGVMSLQVATISSLGGTLILGFTIFK